MPIGTSTGSYYDDNFHAEAGIDTSADEEASANPEVNTDLGLKAGTKETFPTQKDISSVSTDLDKAMSLGMGFAGGGLGRLLYNPITGEAHTTADAIEHLWPVVKNLVNKIPIRIHFGDDVPAEKITDQSPSVEDVFNQNPHLWNQPSNIQGDVSRGEAYSQLSEADRLALSDRMSREVFYGPIETEDLDRHIEYDRNQNPETMSDEDFYNYGTSFARGEMTPAQEARWNEVDQRLARSDRSYRLGEENDTDRALGQIQHLLDTLPQPSPAVSEAQRIAESIRRPSRNQLQDIWAAEDARDAERLKNAFADPDKLLQQRGNMKLVRKDPTIANPFTQLPTHYFGFMGDDGIPHDLNIAEKNGGKQLYVDWIGDPSFGAVNSLGSKNVRDLLRMVKDQFPKAEEIAGLRISGARGRNSGPENASMRLR